MTNKQLNRELNELLWPGMAECSDWDFMKGADYESLDSLLEYEYDRKMFGLRYEDIVSTAKSLFRRKKLSKRQLVEAAIVLLKLQK